MRSVALLGTDTAVGKTVLTAGLVGRLREAGVEARAVKPVQTGYPPDDDAGFVREACGDEAAAVCLRRLEPPLAPAVAADRTGADLCYETLRQECADALTATEVGVIEGIGGLRVPLADDREVVDLVADLARDDDLDLSAVLVARSGLGTLNHTGLSVEALERRGVTVDAIVLNEYSGDTTAERTNPDVLEGMTDVPVYTTPTVDLDTPVAAIEMVRDSLPRLLGE